jgi:DNA-binding beta-propeller fold protein YncE
VKRNFQKLLCLSLLIAGVYAGKAQQSSMYKFEKSISLPGDGGYDYLSIDEKNRHLFVSHGTSVQVIDLDKGTVIGSVDNMKGVHGIAVVNDVNKGFITDGKDNSVVVFDLTTFKVITTIHLSGKKPDAITYDPYSKKVFAFCGDSNNACIIDVNDNKEVGTVDLGGAPEFGVPDGKGLLYDNLEDKSSLVVVDTKTMQVVHTYPLAPCGGPTGLALDAGNQRAFTVCRENKGMSAVDLQTGKVTATVPIGAGVDAVAYDKTNQLVFCSNGDGTATIIKQNSADSYTVVQTLTTQYRAKTMVLDKVTHKIYLSAPKFDAAKKAIPGSFAVLVYAMN